jgi:hypothetical protein
MHVEPTLRAEKPDWLDFPAIRGTLARWGVLPKGIQRQEVAKTGLRVRKILKSSTDPWHARHFHRSRPDMIVLQLTRGGLARWLSKAVASHWPSVRSHNAFIPKEGEDLSRR